MIAATAGRQRVDLLRELIVRDVRLRYRGARLGILWSQLTPIASVAVFTLVFAIVIPLGIPNYPVFVFIGVEVWQWFHGAISFATTSVVANRELVRQPRFPLRLLPPLAVGTQMTYFVLAIPVMLAAVAISTGRIPITALWLPLLVLAQLALCVACGYLLAVLHVWIRDTADVVAVVLPLGFYATPIIYDASRLQRSPFGWVFDVNPMAHLVTAYRDVLLAGRRPDVTALLIIAAASAALAAIGVRIFGAVEGRLPDEV